MKFSAMLLFTTLWMFIVYFPMAHMVWGKGGLLNASWAARFPASISRAARWCTLRPAFRRWCARCIWESAWAIRKWSRCVRTAGAEHRRRVPAVGGLVRIQRRQRSGGIVARHQRFVATHFAAAAAASAGWSPNGCTRQAEYAGRISGAVAGLVAITPASGFVKAVAGLADRRRRRRGLLT
jgi:Amt family ammonium transporter